MSERDRKNRDLRSPVSPKGMEPGTIDGGQGPYEGCLVDPPDLEVV